MDLDGTISTEVAVLSQGKKEDYDDIVTMGLALDNDGKAVPSPAANACVMIPKGAKNVEVAKVMPLSRHSHRREVRLSWVVSRPSRREGSSPRAARNDS
jgi:hypothetical protein